MRLMRSGLVGAFIGLCFSFAANAADLVIWWTKGVNPAEDEALKKVVALWEKETGKRADLSFYATGDTEAKTIPALKAGRPPDITFDFSYDLAYTPTWAFEDLMADVSDVIEPIKGQFQKGALDSAYMLNGKTNARAYYAIPWVQMSPNVHYWSDLLQQAGFKDADVPREWEAFWSFWCDKVQPSLRSKGMRIYGIGQGSSTASNDPFFNVHIYLNAYGAEVIGPDGKLRIGEPEMKKRVIQAIDSYVKPIKSQCSPPDAVNWNGVDDNVSFLNKKNLVAMNPTLSIPMSQLPANPDNYFKNMRTVPWPNQPDGKPTPTMVSVKQVLIFKQSENIENAKSFMRVLLKLENIGPMLKAMLGRFMPVMPALIDDPFYSDPADPHRSAMYRQFTQTPTVPFPQAYNRNYAKVMAEQLWGKMLGRIVLDNWSTEKAIDEMIERMTKILAS